MLQDSSLLQQKCPCPDAVSQGLSHLFLFFLQLHPSPWTRAAPLPDKFKFLQGKGDLTWALVLSRIHTLVHGERSHLQ